MEVRTKMATIKRMEDVRRILSKAMYGKTYRSLTEKQAMAVGKKTAMVLKKESRKK